MGRRHGFWRGAIDHGRADAPYPEPGNGYAAREGGLAAAFVRRMERRFGWHTDPVDTVAIGDLVQASFSSIMAFSEPGDAVLLQLPSYPPFMRAIEDTGRRLIANPMHDDGTR